MPAPHKFSEEVTQQILEDFRSDMSGEQVAKKYGVDYFRTIRKVWLTKYTKADIDERFRRLCRLRKIGDKNPMRGKFRARHHRHNPIQYHVQGYRAIAAPRWYEGPTYKSGMALEHIIVACEKYRIRKLPKLCVVHHKDEDKLNNHPDNLEIMTRAQHMAHHGWIRRRKKVQRLSRKGVQNKSSGSAPISDG